MAHSDADRNFWVRTVIGFFAMLMVGGCVFKYGESMNWVGWTISGVVFVLIVLAIILPPKVYIESVKSINLAGIAGAIKFTRRKEDPHGECNTDNPEQPKPPTV